MARMIDSDAFRNYLKMMQNANVGKHDDYVYYLGYAIEHLNDFTDAESLEIVRCKECRYYNPDGEYCGMWGEVRHPEHFCDEGVKESE